ARDSARHPQGARAAVVRGRAARRGVPRAQSAPRRRQGGAARVPREARPGVEGRVMGFETITLDVDADAKVATLTLNRPEKLNAFNRRMCEEVKDAWHRIKADPNVNAAVLR